jgi:predicted transcriptional regulator
MKKEKGFIESFCNFMAEPDELKREELIAELEDQGIDITGLERRVAEIVAKGSEERRLVWRHNAKQRRAEIERMLESNQIATGLDNLKKKLREILDGSYGAETQSYAEAYFRKKDVVSEEDMESLIQDLEALNLLEKMSRKEGE